MGDALEKMIEHMDGVERLEFAREILHGGRVFIIKQIAAASRGGATKEQLAPLEALLNKYDAEYDLVMGGHVPREAHRAAVERAITEHRKFFNEYAGRIAPKNNIGGLDGGPR